MLIIWKANFSGTQEQLDKVKRKLEEVSKKEGTKVDGPYYAQDSDLMWLFWTKSRDLNMGGRDFLPWVAANKIPIEPVGWNVALTEKEFWS